MVPAVSVSVAENVKRAEAAATFSSTAVKAPEARVIIGVNSLTSVTATV